MPTRFYEPIAGDLQLWSNPSPYVRADLETELAGQEELVLLSEDAAKVAGIWREDYYEQIQARIDQLKDTIDFFDYDNRVLNINVKDGAWFTPVAVESFCGEEVANPAALTIDGLNNTFWQHDEDHAHEIVWELRSYKKRVSKVEIRVGSSTRNELTGLDIYIANSIGGLSNANNLVASGVDLLVNNVWQDVPISKGNGRYVRFADFGSAHATNEMRLAEVRFWVETVEY